MGKKLSKKTKAKTKGNGDTPAPRGSNTVIPTDEVTPFLDRFVELKNDLRGYSKQVSTDIGTLVNEGSIALNVTKGSLRAFLSDQLSDIRREERNLRREETNADSALDYERLSAAFAGTPMGDYAKRKAEASIGT